MVAVFVIYIVPTNAIVIVGLVNQILLIIFMPKGLGKTKEGKEIYDDCAFFNCSLP